MEKTTAILLINRDLMYKIKYATLSFCFTVSIFNFNNKELIYYFVKPWLLTITPSKILETHFIYLNPTEALQSYITILISSSSILTIPLILLYAYLCVLAGLTKQNAIKTKQYLILSTVLIFTAIYTGNNFIIPLALKFLTNFEVNTIHNMFSINYQPKLKEFLNTEVNIYSILILTSQIVTWLLTKNFTYKKLPTLRKYVIITLLCISAIITPPDASTQIIVTCIGLFLLELIILKQSILKNIWKRWDSNPRRESQ